MYNSETEDLDDSPSEEKSDLQKILTGVLIQILDDYIKLQHPASRVKTYLQEHYLEAVDSIFDPEYRFSFIKNDENQDMSIQELINEVRNSDRPDVDSLKHYAINQSLFHWEKKSLDVFDTIPDTVFIAGHTFSVEHAYIKRFTIDVDTHTITLDKKFTPANQINFLEAILSTIVLVLDIDVKASVLRELSKSLFVVLKANNCFKYIGTPPQEVLFQDRVSI